MSYSAPRHASATLHTGSIVYVATSAVHQVAYERHHLGQDPGPGHGGIMNGMHDLLYVSRGGAVRPVLAERVTAQQGAERDGLGLVRLPGGQGDGHTAGPARGQRGGR